MDRAREKPGLRVDDLRLLIVSPSSCLRNLVRQGVKPEKRVSVVAEAVTARIAGAHALKHAPHVIVLDARLADMAPAILRDCRMAAGPRPVVVLASLIDGGTGIDLQVPGCRDPRLGAGSRHDPAGCAEHASLSETIVAAAAAGPGELPPAKGVEGTTRGSGASPTEKWIMVGASTGGVEAIETLLGGFPADCPPTLITQHMPPQFLKSFATRLNGLVRPQVAIARDGITPKRGEVFIAPGGETHLVLDPALRVLRLWPGPKVSGYRPSVDAMFASAVPYASRTIAVILTGMGGDGARSMKALRDGGALCIGQDRESSVIYGMPRMAHELGATEIELPLGQIAPHALAAAQASRVA